MTYQNQSRHIDVYSPRQALAYALIQKSKGQGRRVIKYAAGVGLQVDTSTHFSSFVVEYFTVATINSGNSHAASEMAKYARAVSVRYYRRRAERNVK